MDRSLVHCLLIGARYSSRARLSARFQSMVDGVSTLCFAYVVSSHGFSPSFPTSIAKKLDDSNYFHWRQYVEPIIKSHNLQRFVVNPIVPARFLTKFDRLDGLVNPDYEAWEVQDQTLLVWLQSTLSKFMLSHVLGCTHSYEVYEKIHEYFNLQTNKLRTSMRGVKLHSKSMDEYLLKIKNYVDELAGVGALVRHEEHVDAILEGLPSYYASIVSVIESKKCVPPIVEIKALLCGHETRLNKYVQDTQSLVTPSLHYTQGSYSRDTHQRSGFCSSSREGNNFARGCGHKFANFQCQICLKFGHTANVCHFRSDSSYQPPESLMFIDPTTQQSIPYSTSSYKASHTWTNPNTTSTPSIGPSAMVVQSDSQGKATTSWIPDSGASLHVTGESLNIK